MRVEHPTMRFFLALAFVVAAATPAAAQRSFEAAAARAVPVPVDTLADTVGALLEDCTQVSEGAARRSCVSARRRSGRAELRRTYLLEFAGEGRLGFGTYEPGPGGFRVRLRAFVLPRAGGPGVLATSPTNYGVVPDTSVAAEGFVEVSYLEAEALLATLTPNDLHVRLLVRIGDDFEDPNAPEPRARYGARLVVAGMEIRSLSTGAVVVDTYATRTPPPPPRLVDRARLWSHEEHAETVFLAADGTEIVLSVRLEARTPGDTSQTAVLMQTFGASSIEITRVVAPCCSSSIDIRAHGPNSILAIVTEQSSATGDVGRGRVLLLGFDPRTRLFEPRAEWVGSNREPPPAWVLDPNVDP